MELTAVARNKLQKHILTKNNYNTSSVGLYAYTNSLLQNIRNYQIIFINNKLLHLLLILLS
jgi:hypothetical protein